MRKFDYDIKFSNDVIVTVQLTDEAPVTLWVTLPGGKKVTFTHKPKETTGKKRTVDSGGLAQVKDKNPATGLTYVTVTDDKASPTPPLTMTFGDPEDPIM